MAGLKKEILRLEYEVINGALKRNFGNKSQTAIELGIDRKTLYNKLESIKNYDRCKKKNNKWEIALFNLPSTPCVYCICSKNIITKKNNVLYIGATENLKSRFSNHIMYDEIVKSSEDYCQISVKFKRCDDFNQLEKTLIQRLKPNYNTNFNG